MFEIQVNGTARGLERSMTIDELIRSLDLNPRMVVVEHNGEIIRRERYEQVEVTDGDALELVHFVGGG